MVQLTPHLSLILGNPNKAASACSKAEARSGATGEPFIRINCCCSVDLSLATNYRCLLPRDSEEPSMSDAQVPTEPTPSGSPVSDVPPRKVWWKRWWVIALAVLVVLIVIGAIAGGGDDKKAVSDGTEAATSAVGSSAPATTPAPATSAAAAATDATAVATTTPAPTTTTATTTTTPAPPTDGCTGAHLRNGRLRSTGDHSRWRHERDRHDRSYRSEQLCRDRAGLRSSIARSAREHHWQLQRNGPASRRHSESGDKGRRAMARGDQATVFRRGPLMATAQEVEATTC